MVAPLKKLYHLLDSWVAHVGYIMGQSDQFCAQTNIIRHNDPLSSIVQKPILHVPPFLEVVTANVTERIRERERKGKTEQTGLEETEPPQITPTGEPLPIWAKDLSQRPVTQKERDSGKDAQKQQGSAEFTGKLCKRVMVLIQWKVDADKAVDEHVVQALEGWLQTRGISIYTEPL
jgi:hypothetical protein